MLLNASQIELRGLAREFTRREIVLFAADWDRRRHTPYDVVEPTRAVRRQAAD